MALTRRSTCASRSTPPWPFRIGARLGRRASCAAAARRCMRLLHVGDEPVLVAVAQTAPERVLFAARAATEAAAAAAIARMRFATGVDDDLRPFYERFARRPGDRPARCGRARTCASTAAPTPWEALAWAITEQLIELERAMAIQRRLFRRFGRRCPPLGLRDMPTPAAMAGAGAGRAAVARPRAQARARAAPRGARGRRRPRRPRGPRQRAGGGCARSPSIGPWTLEMLSLYGQGRYDLVPAGDLGFIKLVGRLHDRPPEGARRRGRGARVLRALRRVEGPGGRVPARGRRPRPAHASRRHVRGSSPSPGRNSLVSARAASGGCLSSSFCASSAP